MKTVKRNTECIKYGVMTSLVWITVTAFLTFFARIIQGKAILELHTSSTNMTVAIFFFATSVILACILGYRRRGNFLSDQSKMTTHLNDNEQLFTKASTRKYILHNLKDWAIPLIIFIPYYLTYPNEKWNDYILLSILVLIILYGVYSSFFKKKSTL